MLPRNNGNAPPEHADPRAIERAVQAALWRHRVLGETIVVADGNRIVHLTGDEIPVSKPEP